MLKYLLLVLSVATLASCASAPPQMEEQVPPPAAVEEEVERVDMEALQRHLKLVSDDLGYRERGFNTCKAGYGYSSSRNCRNLTMAVINVRLQCRDSEGTISNALGASELTAIAGRPMSWKLAGVDGISQTDGEGYAQVRGVFSKSPKTERLRLQVGMQFLYVRAHEVTRLVTPKPWCTQ